jgi:hypothetical protein
LIVGLSLIFLKELRQCKFHTEKIPYVQRKTYEPDFIFYDEEEELLTYIEVKGRFRDRAEAKKYVDIRDSLLRTIDLECAYELVFIFQNPRTAMPFARKRADGTKFTMEEWADKNGFTYYTHRVYQTSGDLKDDNTKTE